MKKNQGLSLVELIIVVAIIGILLTIVIPSLNALLGFEAQGAEKKLTASLDFTRQEALDRLVGEMRLYQDDKGNVYTQASYHDGDKIVTEDSKQICNKRAKVSYKTDTLAWKDLDETGIILTYDRVSGGFLKIQTKIATVDNTLKAEFYDSSEYCQAIRITGGARARYIQLGISTGAYQVTKEEMP